MEQEAPRKSRSFKVLFIVVLGVAVLVLIGSSGNNTSSSGSSTAPNTSDLNVTAKTTLQSVNITNNEATDWTDCYVGVNGPTGWGFDNPPYRTQGAFWLGNTTIPAAKTAEVDYTNLLASDGTRFDINTKAVTTILVDCFGDTRSWVGTVK